MPWSNQSGGGWNGNNNSGGPWGQGPSGPQRGGGNPPDLEEIIRRGQDRLKQAIPGGGSAGSPLIWGIAAVALVGLWLVQAVYTVQPDERGVELRFGKPKEEISMPGLHFHWWPIETVEIAKIQERQISIGGGTRASGESGLMLSGDQNIVNVTFAVLFSVTDPKAYLFEVAGPDEMVRQVAESAMREVVGRRPAQDVFRDNRQVISEDVKTILQNTLNEYGTGVQINTVSIEDAAPPPQVADAFDEVQRAEQDEDRFVEEANQYANQKLGAARGQAAQIREAAAAYKDRVVKEAEGEAQRFISVYNEYSKAPEVTRKRLFLETMEGVLKDSNKVIIEQGNGQGVVPYLPLPEIAKPRQNQTTNTQGGNQ
ncbi:MAG: FtsH protease activity modulator HflK [Nitratireductor sp.]|nr:FtsH protease activity modulator HflK [Nitratireductor sp.]